MKNEIDLEAPTDADASNERLDRLIAQIELEQKRDSFLCPSGTISKELCHYSVQIGFSVAILGFSIHNLLNTENFHDLSVSLISMIVGIYLPAPQIKNEI